MSIPASQIVQINPRLLVSGGDDLEFNGLFLSKSDKIPSTQLVIPFPDPDSVGAFFGVDSEEYTAATVYFAGYDNSFRKPRAVYFAAYVENDHAAWLKGGSFSGLEADILTELKKITNGDISLTCGPSVVSASNLDFSTATSLSEIAEIIQDTMTPPTSAATNGYLTGNTIDPTLIAGITDGSFCIEIDGVKQTVQGIVIDPVNPIAVLVSDLQYKLSGCTVTSPTGNEIVITSNSTGSSSSVDYPTAHYTGTDLSTIIGLSAAEGAISTNGADKVYPATHVIVEYNSAAKCFTIKSSDTGPGAGVSYATGSIADVLKWTESTNATLSPGIASMSLTQTMNDILDLTQNFVLFTTMWQANQAEALELAQWSTARGVSYLYVFWDENDDNLKSGTTTISDVFIAANIASTCSVYGGYQYAAMILGTAASIDWDRRQGVITFAFKSQAGIPANVVTGLAATNCKARKVNFMGDYATRNDNFIFMYPGCMFGEWQWIDTYVNAIWLVNALQVAIMNGLKQTPRVPYNVEGYTLIRAWIADVVSRAYKNGTIDSGVSLSETVKAEIFREAGQDISSDLDIDGYFLQILDPGPEVRKERESPECSFWYTYGGSVHRVDLASTVIV